MLTGGDSRRASKVSMSRVETGVSNTNADRTLEGMGYTPELSRNRSIWQVTFMCFILSSVPYGLSTTLYYPLVAGGPANIVWGWVCVSFLILCVAISLAEITSVYPTAGGVYYQTFVLSPLWCRRVASWICGWSYVAGNITITLAVNFGTALLFIGCLDVFGQNAAGEGITSNFQAYQTFLIFLAITLLTHAISAFCNKWLPWLETFAIFWTIAGLMAIVICLLVIAKGGRREADWVFGNFEPQAGWPAGWSFFIGLLQAAYATSATGMIISLCEEVREPAVMVPKAMVGTIVINFVAGLIFLIPVCFVMPLDLTSLINASQPLPVIFLNAVGNPAGAFCLTIPLLVLGLICGVGCATATSRCTWAFARDGGIPGSGWWRSVNKKLDIPFNALVLGMVVEICLGAIYFGSSAAYNAFSGVGVIFLTMSYACPVAVSLIFRRREDIKNGSFNFGIFGAIANVVALGWSLLAIPLFCMPTTKSVTKETMNYASVVFFGFVLIAAIWYGVWGYNNYRGPPTDAVDHHDDSDSLPEATEELPDKLKDKVKSR
ncbi:hypothetical protein N7462_000046 [Penicillium macrosclerotiorum]|uniref:uncharacterized protein n=1 Tax=Penicillium macrosclerotiorum TaxID=303699 RepID=UPI002548583E|nr:uncharacterized protein N7462_000046 [Penicillium macrosclerotiorum]KAJ5698041.1 hypothetical protein N7462_000046 [Penicillium macrosclerotiorum]